MKKLIQRLTALVLIAAFAGVNVAEGGDTPRRVKVEVTCNGISTNVDYTAIADSSGWREIDRIVVPPAVATGTVTVALCELGTVGTNGVYAQYTETVATSGTIATDGTYMKRPYLYRIQDGTNEVQELYSGSLLKTTVTQAEASTNVWTVWIYVK